MLLPSLKRFSCRSNVKSGAHEVRSTFDFKVRQKSSGNDQRTQESSRTDKRVHFLSWPTLLACIDDVTAVILVLWCFVFGRGFMLSKTRYDISRSRK